MHLKIPANPKGHYTWDTIDNDNKCSLNYFFVILVFYIIKRRSEYFSLFPTNSMGKNVPHMEDLGNSLAILKLNSRTLEKARELTCSIFQFKNIAKKFVCKDWPKIGPSQVSATNRAT